MTGNALLKVSFYICTQNSFLASFSTGCMRCTYDDLKSFAELPELFIIVFFTFDITLLHPSSSRNRFQSSFFTLDCLVISLFAYPLTHKCHQTDRLPLASLSSLLLQLVLCLTSHLHCSKLLSVTSTQIVPSV